MRAGSRTFPHSVAAIGVCVSSAAGMQAAYADALDADSSDPDQAQTNNSGTLDQVVVPGVGSLLESKLPENLQDTPQSISVVSQKLIQDQAATRLEETLRNVPGITLNAGEGAARGDTINLRGFSAFNDFFLDGIRDAGIYARDSFNLDTLEVVKGASAILFGRGSTGGAINQISKAPGLTPLESATATFGSNDLYRATTDVNVPLSGSAALRFNAMAESSEIAERALARNHRWGIAPTLAVGIDEANTLTIAYLHQQENNRPDSGIPFLYGSPAPVRRDADYGLTTDRVTTFDDIGTVRFRHEFDDDVALFNTSRYASYQFSYLDTMPNYGGDLPAAGMPLSEIVIGRDAPGSSGLQTDFTNQTDLVSRFTTGPIKHALVTGIEFSRQTLTLNRYVNPFNSDNDWIPLTPLLQPDPYQPLPAIEPVSSQQNVAAVAASMYATDTLSVGAYVKLIGGLRFDRYSADYHQVTYSSDALLALRHVDNVVSPRAALVFKPGATQSYYFSYGTSFDPSAEALVLTTQTANLGPVKARTFEAGAKYSLRDGTLDATGAVFHTVVDNAQTNDPENPAITTLDGNQRVDGGELGLSGHLTRQLEMTAGYTYLDARTIASGTGAYIGKFLPNTARNAVNLWMEYEFSDDLELGLGGNWLDHRFADYAESASVPGYVVWDAMASYRLDKSWYLQLNSFNLANKLYYGGSYYTSASENHIIPGAGRSVRLTIRFTL